MKIKVLSLLILLSVFSCGNDDDTIPSRKEFTFEQNAQIVLQEFDESSIAQTTEGENLVFRYRFIGENDPDIADEEFSEDIIFEIDPSLNNFSYANDELAGINTHFTLYCFCGNIGSILITEGLIQGEKNNDSSWSISLDVTFTNNDVVTSRSASGNFTLE